MSPDGHGRPAEWARKETNLSLLQPPQESAHASAGRSVPARGGRPLATDGPAEWARTEKNLPLLHRPQESAPKKGKQGGIRVLGIPSVVDRVAQAAAAMALEPGVELIFHEDSYGYRPGRAPVDAVAVCRERCFKKDWVVDLDIRAFLVPSSHCQRVHAVVSKRAYSACGISIRRPFRRPLRTWMASSSPRFTRCNTVWRLTPSIRIASNIGT